MVFNARPRFAGGGRSRFSAVERFAAAAAAITIEPLSGGRDDEDLRPEQEHVDTAESNLSRGTREVLLDRRAADQAAARRARSRRRAGRLRIREHLPAALDRVREVISKHEDEDYPALCDARASLDPRGIGPADAAAMLAALRPPGLPDSMGYDGDAEPAPDAVAKLEWVAENDPALLVDLWLRAYSWGIDGPEDLSALARRARHTGPPPAPRRLTFVARRPTCVARRGRERRPGARRSSRRTSSRAGPSDEGDEGEPEGVGHHAELIVAEVVR
jgi:hypothetical protein